MGEGVRIWGGGLAAGPPSLLSRFAGVGEGVCVFGGRYLADLARGYWGYLGVALLSKFGGGVGGQASQPT